MKAARAPAALEPEEPETVEERGLTRFPLRPWEDTFVPAFARTRVRGGRSAYRNAPAIVGGAKAALPIRQLDAVIFCVCVPR